MNGIVNIITVFLCMLIAFVYFRKYEASKKSNEYFKESSGYFDACFFLFFGTGLLYALFGVLISYLNFSLFARVIVLIIINNSLAGWIANLIFRKVDVIKGLYPVGWVWENEKTRFVNCIKWGYLALIISLWALWEVKKEHKNDDVFYKDDIKINLPPETPVPQEPNESERK